MTCEIRPTCTVADSLGLQGVGREL
jgi:hypothetical protein